MLPQPGGKRLFGDVACGDGEHGQHTRCVVGSKRPTIQAQKKLCCYKARALVAIDERMVARNAVSIRGC